LRITRGTNQQLVELPDIPGRGREQMHQQSDTDKDELHKQIGQLKVELGFSKKELASLIEDRRRWIDPTHPCLGIQQQCELLGVPRSTYYGGGRKASRTCVYFATLPVNPSAR
jgi:hypothetical protein